MLPALAAAAAIFVGDVGAQAPAPTSIWQRVHYPPVPIPGSAGEVLSFTVASGGHTKRPQEEPSHLRLDMRWSPRHDVPLPTPIADVSLPAPIADPALIVVTLHTGDGKVVTLQRGLGWMGTGNARGMQWHLIYILPWSRNALDEAWFEVRVPGQTWWVELPYGFARNPEDPEIPDRDRGEPRFPPSMLPLGEKDILVPWLAAEYEMGRIHDGSLLYVKLGNPFGGSASVSLYRDQPQTGPDRRLTLDAPRIAVSIEAGGDTFTGRELGRRLSDDGHTRTDDFTYGTDWLRGRAYGTVTITVDGQRYGVRVPSSLFGDLHGRTDYYNKQWMVVPR